MRIRVGTRGSALARRQTDLVCAAMRALDGSLEVHVEVIATEGDLHPDRPVSELWAVGGFTSAIEKALLQGRIDVAVHSLKDLPVEPRDELVLATPPRAAAHDVLVTAREVRLDELPRGLRIGTGSPRRSAQLRRTGPVEVVDIRGNVPTRLGRVGADLDGVMLAAAGLERLGLRPRFTIELPVETFVPAAGQGALAVQTRRDERRLAGLLETLDDGPTRRAVTAERACLGAVGAGCRTAVGAHAVCEEAAIVLRAQLFDEAGGVREGVERGEDPEFLGRTLGDRLSRGD